MYGGGVNVPVGGEAKGLVGGTMVEPGGPTGGLLPGTVHPGERFGGCVTIGCPGAGWPSDQKLPAPGVVEYGSKGTGVPSWLGTTGAALGPSTGGAEESGAADAGGTTFLGTAVPGTGKVLGGCAVPSALLYGLPVMPGCKVTCGVALGGGV